jgi:Ca2+/Na+ antiporter
MSWEFSIGWFIFGLIVLIAGGLIVVFYKQIADNFAHGIGSYDHTKLAGVITAIIGLIVMANLHTSLLELIVSLVFRR